MVFEQAQAVQDWDEGPVVFLGCSHSELELAEVVLDGRMVVADQKQLG